MPYLPRVKAKGAVQRGGGGGGEGRIKRESKKLTLVTNNMSQNNRVNNKEIKTVIFSLLNLRVYSCLVYAFFFLFEAD